MVTFSEENYLKAIFHLERANKAGVSTNALAAEMETKASSVSDMLKRLSEKELVVYRKYQGVKLSVPGRKTAVEVIRKHRLWEFFLVEKLNFSWDEVHEVAEQLEHIKSEKLTRELDKFLGHPKYDPHGDPIPDAQGNFVASNKRLLSGLEKGEIGICVGVNNSSPDFLRYLDKSGIALGKEIRVLEKENFDQSIVVEVDHQPLQISFKVSNNLYVTTSE